MSKLNRKPPAQRTPKMSTHVVTTAAVSTGKTYAGGDGFARDPKSELYLLAITNMVAEASYYESAEGRDSRYAWLVGQVAIADPAWIAEFLKWLRTGANMRTASIVGAIEAVKARLDAHVEDEALNKAHLAGQWPVPRGINRQLIDSVLARPDECGEAMNYYHSRYGHNIPMPIKRGIADAAKRMYRDWSLLKYDTDSHEVRFADVLELTHPRPSSLLHPDRQARVYEYALFRRHGRKMPEVLPEMIAANMELREAVANGDYSVLLSPDILRAAGMTWEDALSLAGNHVDKAHLWEAIIPSMGYMALLRNLRNFDQAGLSDAVAGRVAAKLADAGEVARSKQFPMRFLSAYRAAKGSIRWNMALNTALEHSLSNIPQLGGRTLILVDTSYSMNAGFTTGRQRKNAAGYGLTDQFGAPVRERETGLQRWDAAVIFGLALARRCEQADIVSFSNRSIRFPQVAGEALLVSIERWRNEGFFMGQGTQTEWAVTGHYAAHDRVVVLTDEQAAQDGVAVFNAVPATIPTYTWNLAGYEMGHAAGTTNRHTLGGLTDASFRMIPLLDYGRNGHWPWEMAA